MTVSVSYGDIANGSTDKCGTEIILGTLPESTTNTEDLTVTVTGQFENLFISCACEGLPPPPCKGLIDCHLSCFSGSTSVVVDGKGVLSMSKLQVGDKVQVGMDSTTGLPVYEPVYMFGHIEKEDNKQLNDFLQIFVEKSAMQPLEITSNHLLFRMDDEESGSIISSVAAGNIKVGDVLRTTNGPNKVTKIKTVSNKGLYMPITPSGYLMVNGIETSSYASIQDSAPLVSSYASIFCRSTVWPIGG
jgi:hypothetical protein